MGRATRRKHVAAAVLVLAMGAGLPAANAAPTWKAFGSGYARGAGDYGAPWVSVESTTGADPKGIRARLYASSSGYQAARVSWYLTCWRERDWAYETASASGTAGLPWTRSFRLLVSSPSYCELDVTAYHSRSGSLKLVLEAYY